MEMHSYVENEHDRKINKDVVLNWGSFYKHREMLPVPVVNVNSGPQISIMTYNIMSCCGKKRFKLLDGTSYLDFRFNFITHEIGRYNSDILCLQEVEYGMLPIFRQSLSELGYEMVFSRHNSVSTMAICYRRSLFNSELFDVFNYSLQMIYEDYSTNCAMMLCLTFKEEFLAPFSKPSKEGLIIVNTHLKPGDVWGYLRFEQTAVLLNFIKKFSEKCSAKVGPTGCYTFLAGDFNSTATDPAYLSMVSKPYHNDKYPIEAKSHNDVDLRAISLYSVGYKSLCTSKLEKDNIRHEPKFSFWGPSWQGLCDYIFIVCNWSGEDRTEVDTLEEFTEASSVKLLALLRMPFATDMCGSLPQVGSFPSDHLCMMADVELI